MMVLWLVGCFSELGVGRLFATDLRLIVLFCLIGLFGFGLL